jgi:hypothetical protein
LEVFGDVGGDEFFLAGFEMSGISCIVTGVLISEENYIKNSAADGESLSGN